MPLTNQTLLFGSLALMWPTVLAATPPSLQDSTHQKVNNSGFVTCDIDDDIQTIATYSDESGSIPITPIPGPLLYQTGPSARRIVITAESGSLNFIDSGLGYGWSYILSTDSDVRNADIVYAEAWQLCGDEFATARSLQENIRITLEFLHNGLDMDGWDQNNGAVVAIIVPQDDGHMGASFVASGPYITFPETVHIAGETELGNPTISYGRDLSFVAHEIIHALMWIKGGPNASMSDSLETSALQESLADVAGVGITKLHGSLPEDAWLVGSEVNNNKDFYRDLKHPGKNKGVSHTSDLLCEEGSSEKYLNSGVPSLAFVRMVEGSDELGIAALAPTLEDSLLLGISLFMNSPDGDLLGVEGTFQDLEMALLAQVEPNTPVATTILQALGSVGICSTDSTQCETHNRPPPLTPLAQGERSNMLMGNNLSNSLPMDGNTSDDILSSYVSLPEGETDPSMEETYPYFIPGTGQGFDITIPSAPQPPFEQPLCANTGQLLASVDLDNNGQGEIILLLKNEHKEGGCKLSIRQGPRPDGEGNPPVEFVLSEEAGIAPAGDFNGDGFDDLLILEKDGASVIFGQKQDSVVPLERVQIYASDVEIKWGASVGDANGGLDDIVLTMGIDTPSVLIPGILNALPIEGDWPVIKLPPATRVFALGNIDDDGQALDDFLLTTTSATSLTEPFHTRSGLAQVILGREIWENTTQPDAQISGTQKDQLLGRMALGADLNGDGQQEIYITDSGPYPGEKWGQIQQWHWADNSLVFDGSVTGPRANAHFGRSMTFIDEPNQTLLVSAPADRTNSPDSSCRLYEGGSLFSLQGSNF